ncbi:MAG TPA: YHS domain-containing protein [Blastocatellia bacterium]|nr:YHS domain-containing protein [Blastocatellia bacterium]
MSKRLLMSFALTIALTATALAQTQTVEVLDGLDPVLLAQGKEVQGELQIAVTRGQFKYLFATAENKVSFEQDPARYEIQLDGACARMGAPVTGNPNLFTVYKGRVYIFGSDGCKKLFDAAPEKYLETAGGASAKPPATPEALKKGEALIEKAVAAMGGAARLDGLTSYHEKSTAIQTRGRGDVEVKNDLLIVFPDRVRHEQVMPDFRDQSVMMRPVTIITPGESFGVGGPRGVFQVPKAYRDAEEQAIRRRPVSLLRARSHAGFKAVALGADKVGETTVEQVAVESEGGSCVLGIDPATGRILSLALRRRGQQGEFGQFVQTFSDFRTVDGLTLPFKVTATFNGQPWKDQSATVEEIIINGKVDPALFEKPKAEKPQ